MRLGNIISLCLVLPVFACAAPAIAPTPPVEQLENDIFEVIDCETDTECQEATGYPYETLFSYLYNGLVPPQYPVLVGHGCEGTTGPIYAFAEDHFPKCRAIERMDWNWPERIKIDEPQATEEKFDANG